jgi:hypothetical protein
MLPPGEAEIAKSLAEAAFPEDKDGILGLRKGARLDWGTKYSMTEVCIFFLYFYHCYCYC